MGAEKIQFLMEVLRYRLQYPGHVVEFGTWQGGSLWFIAKVLQLLNAGRIVYAIDLFEQHAIHPTATACVEEVRRRLNFYPDAFCIEGLVDAENCLSQIAPGPICFAHIDLGWSPKALHLLWQRMPIGAPLLLDNYGHLRAAWRFERFFAQFGARIIRFPWTGQGLVIKPC